MKLSSPIDLIEKSFKIFFEKNNLLYFLKIYLILLPFSLLSLFQRKFSNIQPNSFTQNPGSFFSHYSWFLIPAILFGLAYLVVAFWINTAGIFAVINVAGGKPLDIHKTLSDAWKNTWRFALLGIIAGLLVGFGFLLLIIPGVILATWFFASRFFLLGENKGIKESLSKSRELVRNNFWRVFGRLLVFGIFFAIFEVFLSAVPIFGTFLGQVAMPLSILPSYFLYKELKG